MHPTLSLTIKANLYREVKVLQKTNKTYNKIFRNSDCKYCAFTMWNLTNDMKNHCWNSATETNDKYPLMVKIISIQYFILMKFCLLTKKFSSYYRLYLLLFLAIHCMADNIFVGHTYLPWSTGIFISLYLHIGWGLDYGSYILWEVWSIGVSLLFTVIVPAFIGHVLPWGQIDFSGIAVIRNIL